MVRGMGSTIGGVAKRGACGSIPRGSNYLFQKNVSTTPDGGAASGNGWRATLTRWRSKVTMITAVPLSMGRSLRRGLGELLGL